MSSSNRNGAGMPPMGPPPTSQPPPQQQQPLRHRSAQQHAAGGGNPSFKIFSPQDMHQQQQNWGNVPPPPSQSQGPPPHMKRRSRFSPPSSGPFNLKSLCKYFCLFIILLIVVSFGLWIYMSFVKGDSPSSKDTMATMDRPSWQNDIHLDSQHNNQRKESDMGVHVEKSSNNKQQEQEHTRLQREQQIQHEEALQSQIELEAKERAQQREREERERHEKLRREQEERMRREEEQHRRQQKEAEESRLKQEQRERELRELQQEEEEMQRQEEKHTSETVEPSHQQDDTRDSSTEPVLVEPDTEESSESSPAVFDFGKPVNISYNEFHQQALHHMLENVLHAPKSHRPKGMTLIHFSSHYDLEVPFILHGSYLKSWKKFSSHVSSRAYLMPLVYLGLVKRIVWVRPSWAKSYLQDQRTYKFSIGNVHNTDRLAIDNPELVKAGLLHTGYAPRTHMKHAREGEILVVEGDDTIRAQAAHPDTLLSHLMGIEADSQVVVNIDDSYFSAQNPLLNWLSTEEAAHHDEFNIHAAVNIFNPDSYCMQQDPSDVGLSEFANAFRSFYRIAERDELSDAAFKRLYKAVKPFWCNSQKLSYSMKHFRLVIHTVLHDEELRSDPELENIVERLKELNVYPHHMSTDREKGRLFESVEMLLRMVVERTKLPPFSSSVVLSLRDHLVREEENNALLNKVHSMMRHLFGNVKLIKGFDRQVYSFKISPSELRLTEQEDHAAMVAFGDKHEFHSESHHDPHPAEGKPMEDHHALEEEHEMPPPPRGSGRRESRYERLKRQRAELEREMRIEAEKRAMHGKSGSPKHKQQEDYDAHFENPLDVHDDYHDIEEEYDDGYEADHIDEHDDDFYYHDPVGKAHDGRGKGKAPLSDHDFDHHEEQPLDLHMDDSSHDHDSREFYEHEVPRKRKASGGRRI